MENPHRDSGVHGSSLYDQNLIQMRKRAGGRSRWFRTPQYLLRGYFVALTVLARNPMSSSTAIRTWAISPSRVG